MDYDSPLIKRAQEIITDLTLEYGVWVWIDFEQGSYQITPGLFDDQPDTIHCITGMRYCLGEHKFETIRELRKALENKAFL